MRVAHARTADVKGEVGDVVGLVGQQDGGVAVLQRPVDRRAAEVQLRPRARPGQHRRRGRLRRGRRLPLPLLRLVLHARSSFPQLLLDRVAIIGRHLDWTSAVDGVEPPPTIHQPKSSPGALGAAGCRLWGDRKHQTRETETEKGESAMASRWPPRSSTGWRRRRMRGFVACGCGLVAMVVWEIFLGEMLQKGQNLTDVWTLDSLGLTLQSLLQGPPHCDQETLATGYEMHCALCRF
jgi:hypothetical protein